MTPPSRSRTSVGTGIATPTTARAVGASESAYTCQAIATRNTPSPSSDTHIPLQSSRKSRWRSGVSIGTRPRRDDRALRRRRGAMLPGVRRLEEFHDAVGLHRPCEQEALAEVAAQAAEPAPLLLVLVSLRDDLELERLAT